MSSSTTQLRKDDGEDAYTAPGWGPQHLSDAPATRGSVGMSHPRITRLCIHTPHPEPLSVYLSPCSSTVAGVAPWGLLVWRVSDRREHTREGPSVRRPGVGGLLLDLVVLRRGRQGLDGGRRDIFVREVDPKVFEVKFFRFNPSDFQWLQAFSQLGVLPFGGIPEVALHVGPGSRGVRLVDARQGLIGGERDAHPWALVWFPGF